jgi:hypothetical protein
MSIQQIPPRPNPTDYQSYAFLSWLDNLRNRVFQLINGVGTSTNDNAVAGSIGELISSTVLFGAVVGVTTATDTNITSISLTAGDWDVWGSVNMYPTAGTIPTRYAGWISTTSATLPTAPNEGALYDLQTTLSASATYHYPVGSKRISLASTTTVYLSCRSNFTVSTMFAGGYIAARRRR